MTSTQHTRKLAYAAVPLAVWILTAGQADAAVLKADFNGDGYEDLAVGARATSVNGKAYAGSVQVRYGSPNGFNRGIPEQNWDQDRHEEFETIVEIAEAGDQFGDTLAVGDFDHDGYDDLAVGVPNEDLTIPYTGTTYGSGAVNVIYGSPSGLQTSRNTLLHLSPVGSVYTQAHSYFGKALITGDFNGDGYADLAVGIPGFDAESVFDAGAVAVFWGGGDGLNRTRFRPIRESDAGGTPERNDHFGSVLTAHDFDRDGYDDLVIGIPEQDIGDQENAGVVTLLYGGGSGFDGRGLRIADNFSTAPEAGDSFGHSLAAGDFDGDRFPDLAVSHPGETLADLINIEPGTPNPDRERGAVTIVFGGEGGLHQGRHQSWNQDTFGVPGKGQLFDRFGSSLTAADFDRDGADDLAIGNPYETEGGYEELKPDLSNYRELMAKISRGWVLLLYGSVTGLTVRSTSEWSQDRPGVEGNGEAYDYFGDALTVGDFNRDDFPDLVVGVPGEDTDVVQVNDAGMAHIFYGTGSGLSTNPLLGVQVLESLAVRYFGAAFP